MASWQVQEAKSRFSDLLKAAETKGPQIVTKHGNAVGVVLSMSLYNTLTSVENPDLTKYLLSGPRFEEALDISRDQDAGRDFDFE